MDGKWGHDLTQSIVFEYPFGNVKCFIPLYCKGESFKKSKGCVCVCLFCRKIL